MLYGCKCEGRPETSRYCHDAGSSFSRYKNCKGYHKWPSFYMLPATHICYMAANMEAGLELLGVVTTQGVHSKCNIIAFLSLGKIYFNISKLRNRLFFKAWILKVLFLFFFVEKQLTYSVVSVKFLLRRIKMEMLKLSAIIFNIMSQYS